MCESRRRREKGNRYGRTTLVLEQFRLKMGEGQGASLSVVPPFVWYDCPDSDWTTSECGLPGNYDGRSR